MKSIRTIVSTVLALVFMSGCGSTLAHKKFTPSGGSLTVDENGPFERHDRVVIEDSMTPFEMCLDRLASSMGPASADVYCGCKIEKWESPDCMVLAAKMGFYRINATSMMGRAGYYNQGFSVATMTPSATAAATPQQATPGQKDTKVVSPEDMKDTLLLVNSQGKRITDLEQSMGDTARVALAAEAAAKKGQKTTKANPPKETQTVVATTKPTEPPKPAKSSFAEDLEKGRTVFFGEEESPKKK